MRGHVEEDQRRDVIKDVHGWKKDVRMREHMKNRIARLRSRKVRRLKVWRIGRQLNTLYKENF